MGSQTPDRIPDGVPGPNKISDSQVIHKYKLRTQIPDVMAAPTLYSGFPIGTQISDEFPDSNWVSRFQTRIGSQISNRISDSKRDPGTSFNFKLQIKFKIPNEIWVIQMSSLNPDSIPDSRPQIKDGILDTKWDSRFKT